MRVPERVAAVAAQMVNTDVECAAFHRATYLRAKGDFGPYNVSGSPSLTPPCGHSAVGVPIGMQLIGPHVSEARLLKIGHAYQSATDWHLKRPTDF